MGLIFQDVVCDKKDCKLDSGFNKDIMKRSQDDEICSLFLILFLFVFHAKYQEPEQPADRSQGLCN